MRVSTVSSTIYLLFALIFLSACTERNLQIDYLSKNIMASYQFDVKNAVNQTDIVPSGSTVPFDVECSSSVMEIEIQDPTSMEWKAVTAVDSSAAVDCVGNKVANFAIPLSFVSPNNNPSSPGDQRADINFRLSVKNITGEVHPYERKFAALFKAPTLTLNAANINVASGISNGSTYTVSGTCSVPGVSLDISSSFATSVSTVCTAGSFSVDLVVSAIVDGTGTVTVKNQLVSLQYAYAQVQKNILIDRVAPAVAITSPGANAIINQSLVSNSTFAVAGTCETGLEVTVSVIGNATTSKTSCVNGQFSTTVAYAAQGAMQIKASQKDALDNVGESATVSLTVDTIGPDSFNISGIRSSSGLFDVTVDAILGDVNPQVHFTSSAGATGGYEVYIRSSGSAVCSNTGVASGATSADLASCTSLVHGSKYQIYVVAKDSNGNKTASSNDGFEFTVQFPTPHITSIVAVATSGAVNGQGYAPLGTVLRFDITYDRPVAIFTGTPTITLNTIPLTGKSVAYTDLVGGSRVLRFYYTVEANEYAANLGFYLSAISGATLVDTVTNRLADLSIPAGLYTQTIKIDTTPPLPPTLVGVGTTPPYYFETPAITYTLPGDVDPLSVRMILKGPGLDQTFDGIASGGKISGLNLEKGTIYTLEVYSVDSASNVSSAVTRTFNSFQCPNNFLYVYDPIYAPTSFCIASTEAKGSINNLNFNSAAGNAAPLEGISYAQASGTGAYVGAYGCKSLTPATQYDLPTNAEWNAVANILARVPQNWLLGSVGGGATPNYIFPGLSGSPPSAAYAIDTSNPCSPSDCGTSPYMRRQLRLPAIGTGAPQMLWDFSGNAFELAKDADTTTYGAILNNIVINAAAPLLAKYGPTGSISCSGTSATNAPFCGLGSIAVRCSELSDYQNCTGIQVAPIFTRVLRGGAITSATASAFSNQTSNNAGIFSAYRMADDTSFLTNVGFRCVYHP